MTSVSGGGPRNAVALVALAGAVPSGVETKGSSDTGITSGCATWLMAPGATVA